MHELAPSNTRMSLILLLPMPVLRYDCQCVAVTAAATAVALDKEFLIFLLLFDFCCVGADKRSHKQLNCINAHAKVIGFINYAACTMSLSLADFSFSTAPSSSHCIDSVGCHAKANKCWAFSASQNASGSANGSGCGEGGGAL